MIEKIIKNGLKKILPEGRDYRTLALSKAQEILPKSLWTFIEERESVKRRRFWLDRKTTSKTNHLDTYWQSDQLPYRKQLIDILESQFLQFANEHNGSRWRIFEFGSHVGINLKLLSERVGQDDLYAFAVEPNQEAGAFLREKLPWVSFFQMSDEQFVSRDDFPNDFDLVFVNSVLCILPPQKASKVLGKMAAMADVLVIGDRVNNHSGKQSKFVLKSSYYDHPYTDWLQGLGFDHFEYQQCDISEGMDGFIVARKRHNAS